MKKKKKYKFYKKSNFKNKMSKLEEHNAYSYLEDIQIMGKLFDISKSKRDWIETTRYELQGSANIYERLFAEFLIEKKISFIHQAPYIIDDKIYFLDFYLKDFHIGIELDGQYHNSLFQHAKDEYRDEMFRTIKIKTIRINNNEVKDKTRLNIIFAVNGIKKKVKKSKQQIPEAI